MTLGPGAVRRWSQAWPPPSGRCRSAEGKVDLQSLATKDPKKKGPYKRSLSKVSLGWLKEWDLCFPDGLHGGAARDDLKRDFFSPPENIFVYYKLYIHVA